MNGPEGAAALPAATEAARRAAVDRLEREPFDCVVIGGGITGAGVAREGALRGLRVALLEADDYAAGTSSRSSKLIHGGLRYLAMGDVRLVRATALERKEIHRLAPHLAEPRWLVVPVRSRASLARLRVGITTYEKLGAVEDPDLHRSWSGAELEEQEPLLDTAGFPYACAYREYLTDDARLVLANLRDAARHGALPLSHAPVERIVVEGGCATGVEAACRLSGRRFRVRARCVINAAGPWVEAVRRLEEPSAPSLLHLSKGIHVAVRAERLPIRNMLLLNAHDRRSIFAIPRGAVTYIGTTDTTYATADWWPEITYEDVEYLLEPPARYLRAGKIAPDEVVAAWAGLRPLIAQPGKPPTEISRRDEIRIGSQRVLTIAGGKLTGYRLMAQAALQRAAGVCGLSPAPSRKREDPLPGGGFEGDLGGLAASLQRDLPVSRPCAERLARLYGAEAGDVAARGSEALGAGGRAVSGEVDWAIAVEGAATLEDVLYRRTRLALYDADARESAVEPIAERMAKTLGWSAERRAQEMARVRGRLAADLAFA